MNSELFKLKGKNVLVTGSRRGLGAAIAVALARADANVGCHGRDPKPGPACDEILAASRKTFYFSADLADSKVCPGLIENGFGIRLLRHTCEQRRRDPQSSCRGISHGILG